MLMHKVAAAFAALVLSVSAFAQAAKVTSVIGDVSYTVGKTGAPVKVAVGNDIPAGAVLSTGAKSQAVMRFQDGGSVALAENTNFNLIAFNYNAAKPAEGSSSFDLIRGAFRFITGAIGSANPSAVRISSGTATVGIRGTDFIMTVVTQTTSGAVTSVVNVSVVGGSVSFTTAAGTLTVATGATAGVTFTAAAGGAVTVGAPALTAAGSLGANATTLMQQLQAATQAMTAAGASSATSTLTTTTAGGASTTSVATVTTTGATTTAAATTAAATTTASTIAAATAAVAAAVGANTQTTTSHTTTTHH